MSHFTEALTSKGKSAQLPGEYNYLGKLLGSWEIAYTNHNLFSSVRGNRILLDCWRVWRYKM